MKLRISVKYESSLSSRIAPVLSSSEWGEDVAVPSQKSKYLVFYPIRIMLIFINLLTTFFTSVSRKHTIKKSAKVPKCHHCTSYQIKKRNAWWNTLNYNRNGSAGSEQNKWRTGGAQSYGPIPSYRCPQERISKESFSKQEVGLGCQICLQHRKQAWREIA